MKELRSDSALEGCGTGTSGIGNSLVIVAKIYYKINKKYLQRYQIVAKASTCVCPVVNLKVFRGLV